MVDTTRRQVLKYTPSIIAVLAGRGVDVNEILESNQAAQEATTATLSIDNTSQNRGGPLNQGSKERSDGKSPTSVKSTSELGTLSTGEFTGPPVTTPGGQYSIPGKNVLGLAQSGGSLTEISASGETSPPIFIGETELSFGDGDGIKKIDAATGAQTDIIDYFTGQAGGAYAKFDGQAYQGRSNGMEEIDLSSFDSSKLDNIDQTSPGNLLLLDNGDTIVEFATGDLIKYDIRNERELNSKSVEANAAGLSSNGDYIFASSSSNTLAYDAETLDRVASASRDDNATSSPSIVEDGDIVDVYTEGVNDGIVYAEEFDKENEEFTSKWEKDIADGVAQVITYEDVLIVSASDGTYGLDRETGDQLWYEDIVGWAGTPYDDKIPIAGFSDNKLYELEMEMSEIGGGSEDECTRNEIRNRGRGDELNCRNPRSEAVEDFIDRYGTDRRDWPTMRELAIEVFDSIF